MTGGPTRGHGPDKWRPSLAMVIGGVLAVVLFLPLAGMAVVVAATRPSDVLLDAVWNNLGTVSLAGLAVIAATAVVGFLFWRLVSRPVADLVIRAEQIAASGAAAEHGPKRYGTRELASLAASFGEMVRRLDERSDYIASYTAHVSHELKSPLTAIAGAAEILREGGNDVDEATRARFLGNIERDVARLSDLVARMRDLARAEVARPAGRSRIEQIAPALRTRFPDTSFEFTGEVSLPLPGEDAILVLSHLAANAIEHGAGKIAITVSRKDGRAVVTVANDGEPVSPGNRTRIFEPFFTTRRESGGTGMGLAILRRLLDARGGAIELASDDDTAPGFAVAFRIQIRDEADELRRNPG